MKVIFIADCVNCPHVTDNYAFCKIIENFDTTVPEDGIREDCPLEELGVIKEYTRRGSTQTNMSTYHSLKRVACRRLQAHIDQP